MGVDRGSGCSHRSFEPASVPLASVVLFMVFSAPPAGVMARLRHYIERKMHLLLTWTAIEGFKNFFNPLC